MEKNERGEFKNTIKLEEKDYDYSFNWGEEEHPKNKCKLEKTFEKGWGDSPDTSSI
jgi:hypothetical protein